MKVKLIKRSADGKIIAELEDNVRRGELGSGALRRLEIEANWFLSQRQDRLRSSKTTSPADLVPKPLAAMAAGKTPTVASRKPATSRVPATAPAVEKMQRPLFSRTTAKQPEDALQ